MAGPVTRLARRVAATIARAVVRRVDASTACQGVQVEITSGDVDDVEHLEPYGLTAHPPAGAEALVAQVGGPDHLVALVCLDRSARPTGLAAGEVVLYDDQGQQVAILRTGITLDGTEVLLGAGAAKGVARATDPVSVSGGDLFSWAATITAAVNSLGFGILPPTAGTGTITSGSATVKAED